MTPATIPGATCPKCRRADAKISPKHPVCSPCQAAIRREAMDWQERDALCRYLSTRTDAHGLLEECLPRQAAGKLYMLGLLTDARRLGLVSSTVPAPMTFDSRCTALMRQIAPVRAGQGRGVASRAKQVSGIGAASLWSATA